MQTLTSMPEIKPGDVIAGRFRIVELVGRGGFSVVYRAYQESMNRFVALKFLKPSISNDEKIVERFRREALFASHLSHPNTITLFDYGSTDHGLFYIAMEYLEGRDLGYVIQKQGCLSLPRIWSVMVQCCQSLVEAHKLSLIHRDLKPENIFLVEIDPHEQIKVLDFGLSKALRSLTETDSGVMTPLTQDGKVFGTPMYMAPEQAMDNPISPAIDVYALGHIAWEMITGEAKYAEMSNPMDIMLRQIYDAPLALPEPWDDTPFAGLIHACTRKAPEDRLRNAGEVLELLRGPQFAAYRDRGRSPLLAAGAAAPREESEGVRDYVDQLMSILDGVHRDGAMQLTLLTGPGGGGRDEVLRTFLKRCVGGKAQVVHRTQGPVLGAGGDAATEGLRSDLAALQGVDEEGASGLFDLLGVETPFPDGWLDNTGQRESAVFGRLADRRASLLSRCGELFRRHADDGPLIWALESLEDVDAFTLAFLNWFFQDLQTDPAPVMIVATLDRQGMMRRTGMLRYTQAILGASAPHAHQISVRPSFDPGSIEEILESGDAPDSPIDGHAPPEQVETEKLVNPLGGADPDADADVAQDADEPSEARQTSRDGRQAFDQVLAFLAQFGDEIPDPLLEDILQWRDELPEAVVDPVLDWAERFGIIHRNERMLRFAKHSFGSTLRKRWRRLHPDRPAFHRRVARTLLDHYETLPRPLVDLVVEHFLAAGRPARAAELLFETGDRAFRALNLDAAREHLMRLQRLIYPEAADAPRDLGIDPVRVWIRLGEVHGALEEHGAAEDALRKAARHARGSHPRSEARALKLLGDLQSARGRSRRAANFYREARQHFQEADDRVAGAAVATLLGSAQLQDGRPDAAVDTLSAARRVLREAERPLLEARTAHRLGESLNRLAEFERAGDALQQGLAVFEDLDRTDEAVKCLVALGEARMGAGRHGEARDAFAQAHRSSQARPTSLPSDPHFGLIRALAALRDWETAGSELDGALEAAYQSSDRSYHAILHLYRGDLHLACERRDRAEHHYEELRRRSRDVGHTDLYMEALVRKAVTRFDDGDTEAAWEELERAMSFVEEFGTAAAHVGIRARALYLQAVDCDYEYGAGGLKGLLERASSEIDAAPARLISMLGLADAALAADEHAQATRRLEELRLEAARLGEFAILLPIHRRQTWLAASQSDANTGATDETAKWTGVTLGALFPPEVGRRRHPYA